MSAERTRTTPVQVLRAVGTGLMAGLLAVIVLIGIAAIIVPAVTRSTPLTVMTSSMEPDFPPGTLVVVRPTPAADIAPGDVVTYQLRSGEPTLVTHRVMEQHRSADGEYLFVTKGDANRTADPGFVQEVQVRGTVWYAIPWVGWVSQLVTGDVRAVVVPVIAGGLGVYAVWMIVAGLRERSKGRREAEDDPDTVEVATTSAGAHTIDETAERPLTRRELRRDR